MLTVCSKGRRRERWLWRKLAELLDKHKIAHVTDPLKLDPVFVTDMAYFRVHGMPGYNLKYTYTNHELQELHRKLKAYEDETETVYVFFNNYAMYRDAQRLLTLNRTGKLPLSPFGAKSVTWTLRVFENWPATKSELLEKCGEWYCWIVPNKSVKLKAILRHFRETEYADTNEVEKEARRIWDKTGYLSLKQVEKADELSR